MILLDYICIWMNKSFFEEFYKFFDDFFLVDKCCLFKIFIKLLNFYNCKYIYIYILFNENFVIDKRYFFIMFLIVWNFFF